MQHAQHVQGKANVCGAESVRGKMAGHREVEPDYAEHCTP